MLSELQSIQDNKTWVLCDLPPGRECIGTKWVFKVKRDGNNELVKYKGRLVAKGYSQIAGLDFNDTYAPVVRIESVRVLLAIAAFYGMYLEHYDCKTAFLNSSSDLELYIQQPEGFVDKRFPHIADSHQRWQMKIYSVVLHHAHRSYRQLILNKEFRPRQFLRIRIKDQAVLQSDLDLHLNTRTSTKIPDAATGNAKIVPNPSPPWSIPCKQCIRSHYCRGRSEQRMATDTNG